MPGWDAFAVSAADRYPGDEMAGSGSQDEDNASFAPIRPDLYETEPGFQSVEAGAEEVTEGRHQRREPGEVPDATRRPLAERIRESGGS